MYTRGLARARHNAVANRVLEALTVRGVSSWSYVGELDDAIPDWLAGDGWKQRIRPVKEVDYGGVVRMVRHVKPDALLADCLAPERTVVVMLDFFICVEYLFESGCEIKESRYQQLCDVVVETLGEGDHSVTVQPIPVGRNGIPHPEWGKICQRIKCRRKAHVLWKDVQGIVLSHAKSMFNAWQNANGLGM